MNRKTIIIKLDHSNQSKIALLESVFNSNISLATHYLNFKKEQLESKDFSKDPKTIYKEYRLQFPDLNSALIQQTIRRIDELVKSYISWCKKKKKLVSFPSAVNIPLIIRDVNVKESNNSFDAWFSLWKTKFPLKLCQYHQKLFSRASRTVGSKIKRTKNSSFELHLSLEFDIPNSKESKSLGVDLGMARPIVCSDGKQIGNGKLIKHKKLEFKKRRSKDQSNDSAILAKQAKWQNDYNHKLSKELITHCLQNEIDVLVLEDLKGQPLSNKKYRKYSWAFKDLIEKIKYKALDFGITIVNINPAYTSQTCSCCGYLDKTNRKTQSLFHCESCGTKLNADVNGAKNILNQRLRTGASDKPVGKAQLSFA